MSVALSAIVVLLAGCAPDPVAIAPRDLSPQEELACRDLVDDLPDSIGDLERGEVTPTGALGATWGDPPVVLTCGGDVPEDFTRTAVCQEANGVGWYVPDAALEDESLDVTLTAVGYRPIVTVEVPAEHRPEGVAAVMAALARPVRDHTELVKECL